MAYEKHIFSVSLEAETDMTEKQYHAVKVSNPYKCDIAGATTDAVGVVVNNPRQGMAATVVVDGIVKIQVADGATVTAGKGVAITDGKASGEGNLGIALETVTGAGLATVLLGVTKTNA